MVDTIHIWKPQYQINVGVDGGSQFYPKAVELQNGLVLYAWNDTNNNVDTNPFSDIVGRFYNILGDVRDGSGDFAGYFQLNDYGTLGSEVPFDMVALDNGGIALTYAQQFPDGNTDILVEAFSFSYTIPPGPYGSSPFARIYNASQDFTDLAGNGAAGADTVLLPSIASNGEDFVVTFDRSSMGNTDFQGVHYDRSANTDTGEFGIGTGPVNYDRDGDTAYVGGNYASVYEEEDPGGPSIHFEVFNTAGAEVAAGQMTASGFEPKIAWNENGTQRFMAVWQTGAGDIQVQSRLADGSSPTAVRTIADTTDYLRDPAITPLGNGEDGFFVAWHNEDAGLIEAVVLDHIGISTTDIVTLASADVGVAGVRPSLTTLSDGRVIVSWTSGTDVHSMIADPRVGNILGTAEADFLTAGANGSTVFGFSGNNRLFGQDGPDRLFGGSDEDYLEAGGGHDTLNGGLGIDVMIGGSGNDDYYVSSSYDVIVEEAGGGYDEVFTGPGVSEFYLPDHVERLNFGEPGDHIGRGNALDNRFAGNIGVDRFLIDEGGADIFSGGAGLDIFDARTSAIEVRIYLNDQSLNSFATAGDIFASIETFIGSATADDVMRAGAGRARFSGSGGDDRLWGGNNIDYLRGDAGNDDLRGGAARDTIIGGTGNDDLYGGNDRDQFRFVEADFGQDTIHDWQDGLDYLLIYSAIANDVSDFTISGNGTSAVRMTLNADPTNFIDIHGNGGSAVTIDAGDVQFY